MKRKIDKNTKTKNGQGEVAEMFSFIVRHMATKEDLEETRQELKAEIRDARAEIVSKTSGLHNRLDQELDKRKVLENDVARIKTHLGLSGKALA